MSPADVAVLVLLVISLGAHEAAHGWVALKCGDTTARDLGRITLNPLAHIDPFMTIILPVVMFFTTGVMFGGAKPVPVNFYNLRRPYRDMALVALAGPLSNFLIAALLYAAFHVVDGMDAYHKKVLPDILHAAMRWNLLLSAFNLLPIPPLDGSRVMAWLLPRNLRPGYVALERFGLMLVFGLIFLGRDLIWGPIDATMKFQENAIHWIVTLGGAW
jgi:Zn-dependent protease